jgi:hypothetical protein
MNSTNSYNFTENVLNNSPRFNDLNINVVGQNGLTAQRMPGLLGWAMKNFCPHLLIINAGTNDIHDDNSAPLSPHEITNSIKHLHDIAYSFRSSCRHKIYTAVLNIPERLESSLYSSESELRQQVNHELLRFVHSHFNLTFLIDIENQFDQSIPYNKRLWSRDWTHLSVEGYDSLAYLVFKSIAKYKMTDKEFLNNV